VSHIHLHACVYVKVTYADCCEIVSACKSSNVILVVCHVLRYLPEVHKITELIRSGALGDVVCIQHTEPVGHASSVSSGICTSDMELICNYTGPSL